MKKVRRIALLFFALIVTIPSVFVPVSAAQGTTYTYSISIDGDWIRTQEAYVPSAIYMKNIDLNQPNDFYIKGNKFYIADTGNHRLVIFDRDKQTVEYMGEDIFTAPSGVFVDDSKIYVADAQAPAVFILDLSGNLLKTISRPDDTILMSKRSIFSPMNVVVATDGNIYVVGEGAYEGLMQFDPNGVFQGYFATNKRSLTFLERIEEALFTRKQKERLLTRTPRPIQNIDISPRNLIYSVTQSAEVSYSWAKAETKTSNALKMHNMAGVDILSPNKLMDDEWNFIDIASGPYGNCYALTYTGLIYEYDSEGNLIFSFGGRAVTNDRYGLFTYASAIDLDDNGFIYVLDKERGLIQAFTETDFAVSTHQAIHDLETGNYAESEQTWKNILQLNGMSQIAHIGYGKCLYRQQRYKEALCHFKTAGQHKEYSECFWEIRNQIINKNIVWVIAVFFVLVTFLIVKRFFFKPKKRTDTGYLLNDAPPERIKRLGTDIKFAFYGLRHPADANYYLKNGKRGSVQSASIFVILAFGVYLLDVLCRGFIFNSGRLSGLSFGMISLLFFASFLLFIIGNYMVATINEGEGTVKSIYIACAYSLIPYILFSTAVVALSYVLTSNEGFILQLLWTIGVIWSASLVFVGIMQTHNYSFGETVKNILLTIIFMILALVVSAILYLAWDKVIGFIKELWAEVVYRAES